MMPNWQCQWMNEWVFYRDLSRGWMCCKQQQRMKWKRWLLSLNVMPTVDTCCNTSGFSAGKDLEAYPIHSKKGIPIDIHSEMPTWCGTYDGFVQPTTHVENEHRFVDRWFYKHLWKNHWRAEAIFSTSQITVKRLKLFIYSNSKEYNGFTASIRCLPA